MLLNNPEPKSKCNDSGFAIFFILSILCNLTFAIYGHAVYGDELFKSDRFKETVEMHLSISDLVYCLVVVGASTLYAVVWILVCSTCPRGIIKMSLIAELIMYIVLGFISAMQNPLYAIPFLIMVLLRAVWLYFVWSVIPFCQALFTVALRAFRSYPHPIFVHILMVLVTAVVLAMDMVAMLTSDKVFHFENGDEQSEKVALFSFGFVQLVFLYWHQEVFSTVAYVTSCGVMVQYLNRERVSTMAKLVLSCTALFGSICMGTLITAIIMALRVVAQQKREEAQQEGNFVSCVIFCCIECLLRILGEILEYINTYAYVYVAKNQQGYLQSAKDVWGMFLRCGYLPLVNDGVLAAPLVVGALVLAALECITGTMAHQMDMVSPVVAFVSGIIGLMIYIIVVSVLMAYIKTTFVMWAENEEIFAASHPRYSQQLTQAASARNATNLSEFAMQAEMGQPAESSTE